MLVEVDTGAFAADPDGTLKATPKGARGTMMRVEDVAKRWALNVKTVYAMIERGELAARRFGRVLRIPRRVVELLEQASVAPGEKKCR